MSKYNRIRGLRCGLIATTGAALLSLAGGCDRGKPASASSREASAPTVTVVTARKMDVPIIGHPNGTTRALNQVTIRARVKGFLREKHFTEGANVKEGQLLLVIDEAPFKVKVAQATAALEEAEAALRKARESKAKDVAKAQVALDETQLQLDKVEERRERALLARKASSQEDYDRARARVDKSTAQVESSKASSQQATADYDVNILSAQAKIDQAKANLDAASIDLGYCRMNAPISGRAGELQVKLGNLVGQPEAASETSSLVSIQQLDPMGVDIRPASRYLELVTRLVKAGLDASIRVQGRKPHPQKGKVVFVDNTIDLSTSTVLVKAEIPNPDQTLLPGEYVKVDLNVGDYAGAIVVPESAIVETQEGSRVLVVDDQNKVKDVLVKSLDTYQGLAVVESGLSEGQNVIVEGIQLVRPGQTVKIETAALDPYVRSEVNVEEGTDPLGSPLIRIRGPVPAASGPAAASPDGVKPVPPPAAPGDAGTRKPS